MQQDLLIELGTEELPTRALMPLVTALSTQLQTALQAAHLSFEAVDVFATPRRLAVRVLQLQTQQADQTIEKRGPAVRAAFDEQGQPTPACQGFAKSCGVTPADLQTLQTDQGEWVVHRFTQPGVSAQSLIPEMLTNALNKLPIAKRMRWGAGEVAFVRPVHWLVLLLGDEVIDAEILGVKSGRDTQGHRFMAPEKFSIESPASYETQLQSAYVVASFATRRQQIKSEVERLAQDFSAFAVISDALLDEVTALVEWPVGLMVPFDPDFLSVPKEALMSAMIDHQKCFPVIDAEQKLCSMFITVSNIQSTNPDQVVTGNERVMRARLSDAAFFYHTDLKIPLAEQAKKLNAIVFQKQLGTLGERSTRLQKIAEHIAQKVEADPTVAAQAGQLCKADLVSDMVGEFPELQGTMGYYYAQQQGLPDAVAVSIRDHYKPAFAGDDLPETLEGAACALADKLDSLVGLFGINKPPTGDKDPFALRRAGLGVARILIEKKLPLSLPALLDVVRSTYQVSLPNVDAVTQLYDFMLDRLKAWYREQNIETDVFASVAARRPESLYDFHLRIHAVQQFQQLAEAESLAAANKRVSRLLEKQGGAEQVAVDASQLQCDEEKALAASLQAKQKEITPLLAAGEYTQVLSSLASLRPTIDLFFDNVMVMVDDKACRDNRLALLAELRALFLNVADISLLPSAA